MFLRSGSVSPLLNGLNLWRYKMAIRVSKLLSGELVVGEVEDITVLSHVSTFYC
jgi:hypothetical protein